MFAGVEVCTILYNHLKNDRRGEGEEGGVVRDGGKEGGEGGWRGEGEGGRREGGNEGRRGRRGVKGMKERKEGRGRGQNTSYYYPEKQHTLWFVPVHAANES